MMIIKAAKNLQIREFAEEESAKELIKNLDINSSSVFLDFEKCFVDYPGGSIIVDYLIKKLSKLTGNKKLRIYIPYYVDKATLLNAIFLGSKVFDLEEGFSLPYDTIVKKISPVISKQRIAITIEAYLSDNKQNRILIELN